MKTYWDLSESERAKLSREDVETFVAAELMTHGVVRVEPPKYEDEPSAPAPRSFCFRVRERDRRFMEFAEKVGAPPTSVLATDEATASGPEPDVSPEFLEHFLDTDNGRGPIPDEEYERDPGAPWNRGPSATEAPALDLDELERLHARAEPGRWSFVYRHDERVGKKTVRVPSQVVSEGSIIGDIHVSQDGEAIAALHNAAPELIRRARERDELRAEVSRLLAAHDVEERRQEERAVRTKCHDRTRTLGRKSR